MNSCSMLLEQGLTIVDEKSLRTIANNGCCQQLLTGCSKTLLAECSTTLQQVVDNIN